MHRSAPPSRSALALALAALALAAPAPARAFCGFFVSGADAALTNNASQVVLLRKGTRTVMSMSNNYKGPPEDFALVVPVPVVLKKEQVKTLDRAVLARVDRLSAPRLVEYWERDPCAAPQPEGTIGLGTLGTIGRGGGGSGSGYGYGVRVEAAFAVGEYDVVVLSASESSGLERWLRDHRYRIPAGAAAALAPYIRDGMKFFVAKVNIQKVVRDEHGLVVLAPLRVAYEAPELRLPVRLGLLNADGPQDLIVYVIHPGSRFEVANRPNVFIPTNLEVADEVRAAFPSFYAELFDATLAQRQGRAVVTEYAWTTSSCDPCPTPPLSASDLRTLGDDEDGAGGPSQGGVTLGAASGKGPLGSEILRRITRRHMSELRYCYERELARSPSLRGDIDVEYTVAPGGAVASVAVKRSTVAGPGVAASAVGDCFASAVRRWQFPSTDAPTTTTQSFTLAPIPGGARMRGWGGPSYVLTRLHARYDKQSLAEDLIFREAPPVTGGRASWDGTLGDRGAQVTDGGQNNFQGRYIIRHYWSGKVACAQPRYGLWGGPPDGGGNGTHAATGLANAPRGRVQLGAVMRSAVPTLGIAEKPRPLRPGEKPAK